MAPIDSAFTKSESQDKQQVKELSILDNSCNFPVTILVLICLLSMAGIVTWILYNGITDTW